MFRKKKNKKNNFFFQNRNTEAVKGMIAGVEVPVFKPSTGIKIAVNDSELTAAGTNQVGERPRRFM